MVKWARYLKRSEAIHQRADILVSTTLSVALISQTPTPSVDRADRFGLSELYQLRGEWGATNTRHTPPASTARRAVDRCAQETECDRLFQTWKRIQDCDAESGDSRCSNLLGLNKADHPAIGLTSTVSCSNKTFNPSGRNSAPRIDIRVHLDFLAMSPEEVTPQKIPPQKTTTSRKPG